MIKLLNILSLSLVSCFVFAQDTMKLSESAYRQKATNYGWKVRDMKAWKATMNLDSAFCYAEKVLLDTLTGKNIYKTEAIDCKEMKRAELKKDSLGKIFDQAQGRYVKFYYDNGNVKEEGKWYYEYWEGPYKRYYPNSVLAEQGIYLTLEERNKNKLNERELKKWIDAGWGMKKGKWEYFSKEGGLIKIENYDDKGKLIKKE